jgi:membrane protease YdiL (CAAX protease family)
VLAGFLLIWLVLQGVGGGLKSGRGEAGIPVAVIVLIAALLVERLITGRPLPEAARALGLGRPGVGSLLAAFLVSLLLLAFYPIFAAVTGARLALVEGWPWLAVGIFAQGGIAEELLFRGFLFRHLRQRRGFWRAAFLSMLVFAAVHLLLIAVMSPPVAIAATLLAVATSFPLARLFEQGANTLWAPALVHAVIQSIKLVQFPETFATSSTLAWMAACAVIPYLAFAFRERNRGATAHRTV